MTTEGEVRRLAETMAKMTKLAENAWLSSTGTLEGFTDLDGVPAALELVDRYEVRGTIQTADPKDGRQRSSS